MAPSQPTLEPPFKARVQSCCPTFHTILEPGLQPRANQREASCGWPGPAATCRLTQLLLGQESLHLHCRSPERQQGPQLESPHPLLPQGLVLPDRPGPLGRGFVLRKKRKRGRSKGQKQEILANSQQKDDGDQRAIHVCCTPGPTASTSRTSFICHVCPMKQKQRDQTLNFSLV